jgi:hypothetical protein
MFRILACVVKQQLVTGDAGRNHAHLTFGAFDPRKKRKLKLSGRVLNHIPNASRPDLNAFACAARVLAGIGGFLLILTAVLLITTPLTQRIWTWDHFLRGGQDYESSTLVILTFLCLVLVLAHHCKQSVNLLLAARRLFSFIFNDRLLARIALVGAISACCTERVTSPGLEMYNLPLQI